MEEKTELTQEEIEEIIAPLKDGLCEVRIMEPDSNFSYLSNFIKDHDKTVIGLDFDQTLKLAMVSTVSGKKEWVVRGGSESEEALKTFKEKNAKLLIITAQEPTEGIIVNLRKEVIGLGVSEIFESEELVKEIPYKLIRSWGRNEDMPLDKLQKKLATLIVFNTPRRGKDLARMCGPGRIRIAPDNSKVEFYLHQVEEGLGDWSAKQTCLRQKPKEGEVFDELVCPILAWREFLLRTQYIRRVDINGEDAVPYLFLKKKDECDYEPMTDMECADLVKDLLEEANVETRFIEEYYQNNIRIFNSESGQVARFNHLFASRYNKTAAMDVFLAENPDRSEIIFVDDNSDNVWNMFYHIAHKKMPLGIDKPRITSLWWVPPVGGKDERHNFPFRQLLMAMSNYFEENRSIKK